MPVNSCDAPGSSRRCTGTTASCHFWILVVRGWRAVPDPGTSALACCCQQRRSSSLGTEGAVEALVLVAAEPVF
jgi:hypothetical protein